MLDTVTKTNLYWEAGACLNGFQKVTAQLNLNEPEKTQFEALRKVWENYYFGEFARFDSLLQIYVNAGGSNPEYFTPLSISHHNLHRLMEVLYTEIGDGPLSTTRIPERILDLVEVCNRLTKLLEEVSEADTTKRS